MEDTEAALAHRRRATRLAVILKVTASRSLVRELQVSELQPPTLRLNALLRLFDLFLEECLPVSEFLITQLT